MKLTKKLKAEINLVYDIYWKALFMADIDTYTSVLDQHFKLIGTTETEVFFNSMEAIQFLKDTADQIVGNIELRNRNIKTAVVGSLVLITEQSDTYVKIDGAWSFYGKARVSSLLEKKKENWKFIQMHLSFPDTKTEEGQTIGLDKISKENVELKEAIKRRTIDLENKSQELALEVSLERVRTVAMAMKKPEDMQDICCIISTELEKIGFTNIRNVQTAVINEQKKTYLNYEYYPITQKKCIVNVEYQKNKDVHSFVKRMLKDKEGCYLTNFKGAALKEYIVYMKMHGQFVDADSKKANAIYWLFYSIGNGALGMSRYNQPISKEEQQIFHRFRNVFQLAYQRFIDIQKAEVQVREAEIELALERVRARSMAMQHSEELQDTSLILFQQLKELGEPAEQCTIGIIKESEGLVEISATLHGNIMQQTFKHKIDEPFVMSKMFSGWKNQQSTLVLELKEEELQKYNQFRNELVGTEIFPVKLLAGDRWIIHLAYFSKGMLALSTYEHRPAASLQLLERFAKVFEQTYTRFLDLQKAEAQTREAQIEAALERVRSRTMAMQKSVELTKTVALLFEEFKKFETEPDMANLSRGFITTINIDKECFDLWITDLNGNEIKQYFKIDFTEPTTGIHIYKGWKNKQPNVVIDLAGEQLNQWLDYLSGLGFPVGHSLYGTRRTNNFIYHSNGFIGITSSLPLTEESLQLLQRFAKVFDLTYTRFADLQKAEARALVAIKEASLDRVRAEIASMRTAEDLQQITPLVWRELTTLNVPFFRCGLFIVDDEKQVIHFYLSSVDGKPLAALELPIDGNATTQNATKYWRQQKIYTSQWSKEEFIQFANNLVSQGQVDNVSTYQGGVNAPDSLTLQFIPFTQGMMYVGSTEELSPHQLNLVQSLADAFSTAYARYEDFIKLESAKQKIELTLKDLRATQTQLIQSEKMASLGELTAGIAHEIQNPLNFVNNFSEVSLELIEEVKSEKLKVKSERDDGLENELLNDIAANLEKINHHGRRAGDIVKGMLQHSRSSSGVKEPTDINALADEYLRLAYHGLRAKDKSFNATMITDFDESIGNVNIIPQDIGRVILNLITNAFYAVTEKKKLLGDSYEPTVWVTTKLITPPLGGRGVEISVADNGLGILATIKDKIFQPFFTTKPTGQGTGLGLSLSYDIVKAHSGELKVETKEGEGSTFQILIPNN